MAIKNTPMIYAQGVYTVKPPWTLTPNTIYTCVAIRSFVDVYRAGVDVYTTFYESMGLINGVNGFTFEVESSKSPNIITLRSENGQVIYIPDTYILSSPNQGTVSYSHIVLTCSAGALPDHVDLSAVKAAVDNVVTSMLGQATEVQECRIPSMDSPTVTQAIALEAARIAAVTNVQTDVTRLRDCQAKLDAANAVIATMTLLLRQNNLI